MLSHHIADLSTGPYYEKPEVWYEQLTLTLKRHDCEPEGMPEIHTHSGQGYVKYNGREEGQIFFTWHRMPSNRWEIICYKC